MTDLDATTRRRLDLPDHVRAGAVVADVDRTSAAAAAGLRPGDVILEIDRKPVRNGQEAIEQSEQSKGDRDLVRVWSRGGSRYIVIDASKKG